jgi:hypothetical protein
MKSYMSTDEVFIQKLIDDNLVFTVHKRNYMNCRFAQLHKNKSGLTSKNNCSCRVALKSTQWRTAKKYIERTLVDANLRTVDGITL